MTFHKTLMNPRDFNDIFLTSRQNGFNEDGQEGRIPVERGGQYSRHDSHIDFRIGRSYCPRPGRVQPVQQPWMPSSATASASQPTALATAKPTAATKPTAFSTKPANATATLASRLQSRFSSVRVHQQFSVWFNHHRHWRSRRLACNHHRRCDSGIRLSRCPGKRRLCLVQRRVPGPWIADLRRARHEHRILGLLHVILWRE